MEKYSDQELKEIYQKCGDENWEENKEYLLTEIYNQNFNTPQGMLYYHTMLEIKKAIGEEIIKRFVNS